MLQQVTLVTDQVRILLCRSSHDFFSFTNMENIDSHNIDRAELRLARRVRYLDAATWEPPRVGGRSALDWVIRCACG